MHKQKRNERYSAPKLTKHIALLSDRTTVNQSPYLSKYKLPESQNKYSFLHDKIRRSSKFETLFTKNPDEDELKNNKDLTLPSKQTLKLPEIKHKKSRLNKSYDRSSQQFKKDNFDPNFYQEIEQYLKSSSTLKKKPQPRPSTRSEELQVVHRTKAGTNGKNIKINQDIQIIDQRLPYGIKIFCVCDGHGTNGHHVAGFIKKKLIQYLRKHLKNLQLNDSLEAQLYLAFQKTNDDLLNSEINTQLSGSTVVAVLIYETRLYCFNVGDSRAIIMNYEFDEWKAQQLTNDHKPTRIDEAKRIRAAGGRIQQQKNQKGQSVGPMRVWMKNIKSPGLAMTRSFGDKAGIKAGTTSQPQINQYSLQKKNKYILIASDGIWQHLQNHEVMKVLGKSLKQNRLEESADKLMEAAIKLWEQKCFSRDDITFILVRVGSKIDQ